MTTVKIIKFTGETGLRKPGSLVDISDNLAELWIKVGIAEKHEVKQDKTVIETKEEKFIQSEKQTKKRGRKPKQK